MVKTRGEGSQGDRLRPTVSVRRKRRHVNEDEEHFEHEDAEHVEPEEVEPQMEVEDDGAPQVEGEGYPECPLDETLLTGYEDHVAIHLWNGLVSEYVVI